jgi:hypothetical protein
MSAIIVHGYVPDPEYGQEIPYATYIYHTEVVGDTIRFIVWNPIGQFWDIVPSALVRPTASPTQDVPTNLKIKDYNDWKKNPANYTQDIRPMDRAALVRTSALPCPPLLRALSIML